MDNYKKVILCADDYGQKNSVSQAIVQLVRAGRLSAVSCMTTKADWPSAWLMLKPYEERVDIGLHFNLTEGVPLSSAMRERHGFMPLGRLLWCAMTRRLDVAAVAAELSAQLDAFLAVTGRLPDFIDGHQHVHHFPRVREALMQVYAERLVETGCYLRCVNDQSAGWGLASFARFKRFVLQRSGAGVFKRQLEQAGIPHNHSFSGVYPFANAGRYPMYFPRFLSAVADGGLILCHPGTGGMDAADAIAAVRGNEFRYLLGPAFPEACAQAGVRLARFSEIYPARMNT